MTQEEAIKIAIHCLDVQAEQEVCEECDIYGNCHTDCKDAAVVAIKALEEIQQYRKIGTVEEIKDLLATISEAAEDVDESGISVGFVKDLIQLKKYREIGTVEECRDAVEKQTPKKPVKDKYHHNCCPNCGWIVSGEGGYGEEFCPHCENCGQAIQWENLKGMEDENT